MAMDSDEFYTNEQFKFMKEEMLKGDFDSSACQMITYYKDSKYRLDPKEEYYVSLPFKIRQGVEYVMGTHFPVLVDPTRRMDAGNCKIFTREEIEMHHMSFVRNDIRKKLENSSAKGSFNDKIDKISNYYNKWTYPNKVMWASGELLDVKKVEGLFDVKL
jgi:hypothetical protein